MLQSLLTSVLGGEAKATNETFEKFEKSRYKAERKFKEACLG